VEDVRVETYTLTLVNGQDTTMLDLPDTSIVMRLLSPATTYTATVMAADMVGNQSPLSVPVTVNTKSSRGDIYFMARLMDGTNKFGGDPLIYDHMAEFGYNIVTDNTLMFDSSLAYGKLAIVVSSSMLRADMTPFHRDLPVPILLFEGYALPNLAMTDTLEEAHYGAIFTGADSGGSNIFMNDPSHPLAAGLSGMITLSDTVGMHDGFRLKWGLPAPSAKKIASLKSDTTKSVIFEYNTGDLMFNGVTAPARRVNFGVGYDIVRYTTAQGWALFDAALFRTMGLEVPSNGSSDGDTDGACGNCGTGSGLAFLPLVFIGARKIRFRRR
jgi:hypothetical protein